MVKFYFPKLFLEFFEHEALKSRDNNGQIETLALAIGTKVGGSIEIAELVFPSQQGKSDFVEDKGTYSTFRIIYLLKIVIL